MDKKVTPATDEQIAWWRREPKHAVNVLDFGQRLLARIDAEVRARKAAEEVLTHLQDASECADVAFVAREALRAYEESRPGEVSDA